MLRMDTRHPWPQVGDEGQWSIEGMERQMRESNRSPDEMRERARELRDQAEHCDIEAVRSTLLTLAGRWEEAADARVAAA